MPRVSTILNDDLKRDFSKLCDDRGLSMSAALREFVEIEVRNKTIPSKVSGYDENGFITEAELKRRMEDARAGRNLVKHGLDEM